MRGLLVAVLVLSAIVFTWVSVRKGPVRRSLSDWIVQGTLLRILGVATLHGVLIIDVLALPHEGAYIGFMVHGILTFAILTISLVVGTVLMLLAKRMGAVGYSSGFILCLLAWPVAILTLVAWEALNRLGGS